MPPVFLERRRTHPSTSMHQNVYTSILSECINLKYFQVFLLLIYEFKTATSYSFFILSLSRVQHFRGGMITINPNLPKIITSTFLPHTPHLTSCSQEDQDILLGLKEAVIFPRLHCWITSSVLSLTIPWLCMDLNLYTRSPSSWSLTALFWVICVHPTSLQRWPESQHNIQSMAAEHLPEHDLNCRCHGFNLAWDALGLLSASNTHPITWEFSRHLFP